MIDGLRPYAEMKPSGLPWLGDVPAHWDVRRNGRLFGSRRETGFPDLPVLEVSLRSGVRVRDFDNGTRKQEMGDRSKYQRAVRGDIAYNMMRMWQGAVGIAPVDGLVSPAYVVARPFTETDAAYYAYVFRTAAYMREVDTFSRGIVPDRNRLYWESFKQMPSVYPPLDEQRLIVRFLDWHGAQTAKLIRAKKKIIALLNEQKQAIIHRAVTRGLDPNVRLKPSGILWLGDVPEGWEVKKVREIARVVNGYPFEANLFTTGEGHPLIRIRDLDKAETSTRYAGQFVEAAAISPGETLIGMDGDFNVGTWNGKLPALLNQRVCCVRCHNPEHNYFVRLALIRPLKEINAVTWSTTVKHLSSAQVERVYLPIPPADQLEPILTHLRGEVGIVDDIAAVVRRELELVQEFRTRLIADVVTGKLDIRAAAASLPETPEPEPIDDLVEGDDLDEAVDDAENEEVAA